MPNEPQWLPVEVVIEINRAAVAITSEPHFLRDAGLLESAIVRPQNAFAYGESDLVVLAVRLMAGIAQSHAFEQGNKRTAFIAMVQFLIANGLDTSFDDTVSWAGEVIRFVEHASSEEDFVSALRPYIVPRECRGRAGDAMEHRADIDDAYRQPAAAAGVDAALCAAQPRRGDRRR